MSGTNKGVPDFPITVGDSIVHNFFTGYLALTYCYGEACIILLYQVS